jgi:elongation factor P--beta-lysine ligase
MSESTALRLADALDQEDCMMSAKDICEAAAELRRLHAANIDCMSWYHALRADYKTLHAQRDALLEALLKCSEQLTRLGYSANHADQAIAAIKKVEENT